MNIRTDRAGDELILTVEGAINSVTAPELQDTIEREMEEAGEVRNLTLDFTDVNYISSACLRVILVAQGNLEETGSLRIRGAQEEIRQIFEITGLESLIEFI